MSVSSTVADAATVDWNIAAGAVATFLVTSILTWQGFKFGKKKTEERPEASSTILGGALMDNASMHRLSESLQENTEALRQNTASITRATDVAILTHRD